MVLAIAGVFLLGLTACGSASEEELAEIALPLVAAHDALEDFDFKISSGLSRGDFLEDWPDVASQVGRGLEDYSESVPEDLSEVDRKELDDYAIQIAETADAFTDAAQSTRDLIYNDGDELNELVIETAIRYAQAGLLLLDFLKEDALTPGLAPEDQTESE